MMSYKRNNNVPEVEVKKKSFECALKKISSVENVFDFPYLSYLNYPPKMHQYIQIRIRESTRCLH